VLDDLLAPTVKPVSSLPTSLRSNSKRVLCVLSAGVESAWLWHLVAVLSICAELPHHSCDAEDGETEDGRVGLPVVRLSVPTTSW
jgi:hypothetical protein